MARSHEEKARFRGNDKAYSEGWDHIFNKKKECEHINRLVIEIPYPPFMEIRCEDCKETIGG